MKINDLSLYSRYAFRDLTRSYSKILSIIITLLISLFILSAILTIEDSLENELNENSKVLLGGDLEIDYNNKHCKYGRFLGNEKFFNYFKSICSVMRCKFNYLFNCKNTLIS